MKRLLTVHGSSNVKMIGYDVTTCEMDVVYHAEPNILYRYQRTPPSDFLCIIAAESVGKMLRSLVGFGGTKRPFTKHSLSESSDYDSPPVKAGPVEVVVPRRVTVTRIEGYNPALGPTHPENQDPTLEASPKKPPMTDEDAYNSVINRGKKRN